MTAKKVIGVDSEAKSCFLSANPTRNGAGLSTVDDASTNRGFLSESSKAGIGVENFGYFPNRRRSQLEAFVEHCSMLDSGDEGIRYTLRYLQSHRVGNAILTPRGRKAVICECVQSANIGKS